MFISTAHATTATTEVGTAAAANPEMKDAFLTNMGLIAVMFILFYVILIRPQQKRMKEQRDMLDTLKKGDKVLTGGGLYATVSKIVSDSEVEIDLGGVKVIAARYTLQTRQDDEGEKEPAKKAPAKKTASKK